MPRFFLPPLLLAGLLVSCSDSGVSKVEEVKEEGDEGPPDGPFSTDWGQWLSMASSPSGQPAITFYDRDRGGIGFALGDVTDGDVTWAFEGVDGYPGTSGLDPGDRGTYTSLAFAPDGTAWATYYDLGAKVLRYGKRHPTLGAWVTGVADRGEGSSQDAGLFSSIAIGADGNPVVAHHDRAKGTLRVARWNGTEFVGGVFDRGEGFVADTGTEEEDKDANVGQFVRLRIVDGIEYMAYYDAANGDLKFSAGTSIEVVDSEGDVGQWPDFHVVDGKIHIVYQDGGNQQLKYAVGTPGDWSVSVIDDKPYTGADTALFFNGENPRVAYFEGRANDMKLAKLSASVWSSAVVAAEGAVGFHNEVVQIDGKTYVACYNYTKRDVYFAEID
jgi:hypothetical protein